MTIHPEKPDAIWNQDGKLKCVADLDSVTPIDK